MFSFAISFGSSFFLSPYLVKNIGEEAYGFVPLINNVINIAQIVTVALNSMASRFIAVSLHKEDYESANKYFNSVIISNVIISIVLLIPAILLVVFVDSVFNVPAHLVTDVRVAFALLTFNFMVSICFTAFHVGTFATNRLDISSIRSIIGQFLRAAVIVVLFSLFSPSIVFTVIASVVATLFTAISNAVISKKLVPQLKVSAKAFDKKYVGTLFKSGVWNSVGTLSYDLFSGLDLIIANIFIDASAMGVLSVSKTVPNTIGSLSTTIISVFMPSLTKYFAKNEKEKIYDAFKQETKILLLILGPILAFLVGFGDVFYKIWMPTLQAKELQILSILALLPLIIALGSKGLANTFTVYNKIKLPSLVTLGLAALSTITVFVLLKTTNLGVYAIAGVSSFYLIIKEIIFVPIYAAKCMNVKYGYFFKNILKSIITMLIVSSLAILVSSFVNVYGWFGLFFWAAINSFLALIVIVLLNFSKKDIKDIFEKITSKKHRQK